MAEVSEYLNYVGGWVIAIIVWTIVFGLALMFEPTYDEEVEMFEERKQ